MMEIALYVVSIVSLALGIWAWVAAALLRRDIKSRREELQWQRSMVERAISQLASEEEDEAIAGVQTVTMLGRREEDLAPLEIARRRWTGNERVVEHVNEAAFRLASGNREQEEEGCNGNG